MWAFLVCFLSLLAGQCDTVEQPTQKKYRRVHSECNNERISGHQLCMKFILEQRGRQTDRDRQRQTERQRQRKRQGQREREHKQIGQLLDRTPCQAHSVTGQEKDDQVTEGSGDDRASRKGQKWNR